MFRFFGALVLLVIILGLALHLSGAVLVAALFFGGAAAIIIMVIVHTIRQNW